jgi:sRNA-binding carbon storage regulator CsrA
MMSVDLRIGEAVMLETQDGRVRITVDRKDGQRSRLSIDAPQSVRIVHPKNDGMAAIAAKAMQGYKAGS